MAYSWENASIFNLQSCVAQIEATNKDKEGNDPDMGRNGWSRKQALMYSLIQRTPSKSKCEKKEMKLPILETEGCGQDCGSIAEHFSSPCKALGSIPRLWWWWWCQRWWRRWQHGKTIALQILLTLTDNIANNLDFFSMGFQDSSVEKGAWWKA